MVRCVYQASAMSKCGWVCTRLAVGVDPSEPRRWRASHSIGKRIQAPTVFQTSNAASATLPPSSLFAETGYWVVGGIILSLVAAEI